MLSPTSTFHVDPKSVGISLSTKFTNPATDLIDNEKTTLTHSATETDFNKNIIENGPPTHWVTTLTDLREPEKYTDKDSAKDTLITPTETINNGENLSVRQLNARDVSHLPSNKQEESLTTIIEPQGTEVIAPSVVRVENIPAASDITTDGSDEETKKMFTCGSENAESKIKKDESSADTSNDGTLKTKGISSYKVGVVRTELSDIKSETDDLISYLDISMEMDSLQTGSDTLELQNPEGGALLSRSGYFNDLISDFSRQSSYISRPISFFNSQSRSDYVIHKDPSDIPTYGHDDSYSIFWDDHSSNIYSESSLSWDTIYNFDDIPSMSRSFPVDVEEMQPSERHFTSDERESTQFVDSSDASRFTFLLEPQSSWSFNKGMSSLHHTYLSSRGQQNFNWYFNTMGTLGSSGHAQNSQQSGSSGIADASRSFPFNMDNMLNAQHISPSETFAFNDVLSVSPSNTFHSNAMTDFAAHISDDIHDTTFRESNDNIPTYPTISPTTTQAIQSSPPLQIPYIGNSCIRDYNWDVYRTHTVINDLPTVDFCNCTHFICKMPPPPILLPKPPAFGKKSNLEYWLTKILYRALSAKRMSLWAQAELWDQTETTLCL